MRYLSCLFLSIYNYILSLLFSYSVRGSFISGNGISVFSQREIINVNIKDFSTKYGVNDNNSDVS